jgi:hypothetical protein
LLNTLDSIAKATFKSLADGWADTTASQCRLLVIALGGLAEFERELIKIRKSQGRAQAKTGIMGRPPKTPRQRQEALERREAGEPLSAIARTYGVRSAHYDCAAIDNSIERWLSDGDRLECVHRLLLPVVPKPPPSSRPVHQPNGVLPEFFRYEQDSSKNEKKL